MKKCLTFDDVLMVPKYSEVESRSQVDLSINLPKGITLKLPVLSANMSDVTGVNMARKLSNLGCLPILHRFDEHDALLQNYIDASKSNGTVGVSVGIKDFDLVNDFVTLGCKVICVDVAHGHHKNVGEFVKKIAETYPEVLLIAGNVATAEGANYLWKCGADIIKVGIGPSSVCRTRVETGNGYPQFSAIQEVCSYPYLERNGQTPLIISDGGLKRPGDIAKALAIADLVMIGGMLAATDETPGEIVEKDDGKLYKRYAGSSTHKKDRVEGVVTYLPCKGPVSNVIKAISEGLQSACSYQGVLNLIDFKKYPEFVEITNAGISESSF